MWKSGLGNIRKIMIPPDVFCVKCVGMPIVWFLKKYFLCVMLVEKCLCCEVSGCERLLLTDHQRIGVCTFWPDFQSNQFLPSHSLILGHGDQSNNFMDSVVFSNPFSSWTLTLASGLPLWSKWQNPSSCLSLWSSEVDAKTHLISHVETNIWVNSWGGDFYYNIAFPNDIYCSLHRRKRKASLPLLFFPANEVLSSRTSWWSRVGWDVV